MRPLSSDTTSTTASVSSVMPSAARWRVPSVRPELGIARERQEAPRRRHPVVADEHRAVVERRVGQEQAHEEIRGDDGVQRHAELGVVRAARWCARARSAPPSACPPGTPPPSRRRRSRGPAALPRAPSRAWKSGFCPICARPRRSSGWNSTTRASTHTDQKFSRIQLDAEELEPPGEEGRRP